MTTLEPIRFLSWEEMAGIHAAAKRILGEVGIEIRSHRALDYWADAGCRVDRNRWRVTFPEDCVESGVARMRQQLAEPNRVPS